MAEIPQIVLNADKPFFAKLPDAFRNCGYHYRDRETKGSPVLGINLFDKAVLDLLKPSFHMFLECKSREIILIQLLKDLIFRKIRREGFQFYLVFGWRGAMLLPAYKNKSCLLYPVYDIVLIPFCNTLIISLTCGLFGASRKIFGCKNSFSPFKKIFIGRKLKCVIFWLQEKDKIAVVHP